MRRPAFRSASGRSERLIADPHGTGPHADEYRVSTLYLDTAGRDVFHRRGSYGRSKYRVRRYGDEPRVFLERKLRTASRLAKRRTDIPLDELTLFKAAEPATARRRGSSAGSLCASWNPVCRCVLSAHRAAGRDRGGLGAHDAGLLAVAHPTADAFTLDGAAPASLLTAR
jgi:hypothetical protein